MSNVERIKKKGGVKSFFITVVVILMLFVNEDMLIFGTIANPVISSVRLISQLVIYSGIVIVFLLRKKEIIINGDSEKLIILLCCLFGCMFLNRDIRFGYFFLALIFLTAYCICRLVSIDYIFEVYYKVISFLCVISLCFFFLNVIGFKLIEKLPVITNASGIRFYSVFFCNIPTTFDGFYRNWGPYREPGIFQMYVIISLVYGLFKKRDRNWFNLLVHIVTVVTTFSTTGYIALFFVIIALIFDNNKENLVAKMTIILSSFCVIFYLAIGTDLLYKDGYGSVFGKIFGSYSSLSFNARLSSVIVNLRIFIMNPLFGKGITFVENNFPIIAQSILGYTVVDNTNSICIIMSMFGIVPITLFAASYCFFVKKYFRVNVITSIFILTAIVCLMIGEKVTYIILFYLFIFNKKSDILKERTPAVKKKAAVCREEDRCKKELLRSI